MENLPPEEVWKEHERQVVREEFDRRFVRFFRPLAILGAGLITIGAASFFTQGITVGALGEPLVDAQLLAALLFVVLFGFCVITGLRHQRRLGAALAEVDALTAPRRAYVRPEPEAEAPAEEVRGPSGTRSLGEKRVPRGKGGTRKL